MSQTEKRPHGPGPDAPPGGSPLTAAAWALAVLAIGLVILAILARLPPVQ